MNANAHHKFKVAQSYRKHTAQTVAEAIEMYRAIIVRRKQGEPISIDRPIIVTSEPAIVCGGWNMPTGLDALLFLTDGRIDGVKVYVIGSDSETTVPVRSHLHCWERSYDEYFDVEVSPYEVLFGNDLTVVSYTMEVKR